MRRIVLALLAVLALVSSADARSPRERKLLTSGRATVYQWDFVATQGLDAANMTFSRAGLAMMVDGSGYLTYAPNNVLYQSNTLNNAYWTNQYASLSKNLTDPFGVANAGWTVTSTSSASGGWVQVQGSATSDNGVRAYNVFAYMKYMGNANGGYFQFDGTGNYNARFFNITTLASGVNYSGGGATNVLSAATLTSVGNGWLSVYVKSTGDFWGTICRFIPAGADGGSWNMAAGESVGIVYPVISAVTYETAPRPADLAAPPTGGSLYYGPRFSSAGLMVEPTATNILAWSNDLTKTSAWTASNLATARTQTGPDNVANSATKLTASAGNGTICQAVTLASSQRLASGYVKRVTGSGEIDMSTDGGSTWTAITGSVGATWAVASIPAQTVTNPSTCFRIVTNGDAVAVGYVNNEAGTVATSRIATGAVASLARAAESLTPAGALAAAQTAGPSIVEATSLATGVTSRSIVAAGGTLFPSGYTYRRSCTYAPSVPTTYLNAHMTVGGPC